MPLPPPPRRSHHQEKDTLFKGVLCLLIGLGVLLAPYFIHTAEMQAIVGQSYLVGWFALVLGVALIGRYFWARR